MSRILGRFHKDQRGLSLLELTVVAAIISILAALTAVAVTGTTSTTKSVTRTADLSEMQKAVDRFRDEGTSTEYPTGTTPATENSLPTDGSTGTEGADYYTVLEATVGFDVDGDGTSGETYTVLPVDWTAVDDDGDAFFSTYIGKKPSNNGTTVTINTAGSPTTIGEAWVINEAGDILVLVSASDY